MYDWLIVGGGLHGGFVAQSLAAAAPATRLAVIDDRPALADWQRRADACGMTYLRSSNAHHLGRRADALRVFATENGFDSGHELGYYRRPSRALFEAHAAHALAGSTRIAERARRIERLSRGWGVHTHDGHRHDTVRVVLALGPNAPYRPGRAAANMSTSATSVLADPGPRVSPWSAAVSPAPSSHSSCRNSGTRCAGSRARHPGAQISIATPAMPARAV